MSLFEEALVITLPEEGGFADRDRKADPGGRTQKGITQKTYSAYLANKGRKDADVKYISDDDLRAIYKDEYWDMVNGDRLPAGLGTAVFDFAVHSGPDRAARVLQSLLGVKVDGQIGANTIKAIPADIMDLLGLYEVARLDFLKTLSNYKANPGWVGRVKRVTDMAISQVQGYVMQVMGGHSPFEQVNPLTNEAPNSVKADEAKVQTIKTKPGIIAALGSASVVAPAVSSAAEQLKPYVGDGLIGQTILVIVTILTIVAGIFAAYNLLKPYLKQA